MNEAKKIENQKAEATAAAELAHLKAQAAANQSLADRELFDQAQAVRAEQSGK